MQMMYDLVAKELNSSELKNSNPRDYLNFYCLGNREQWPENSSNSGTEGSASSQVVIMLLLKLLSTKLQNPQLLGFCNS